MNKTWYRIENKVNEADIYLYEEIGMWGVSANDFVRDLQAVDAPTINLHLNSPGGEVFDGIAIYNALKNHKATVNVKIDALAASAASFIAQAGDKITIAKSASIMIHEAHGFAMGDSATMLKMAEELDMIGQTIAEIYADRAGGEASEWRSRMGTESWYRGQEAVDIGLADEVEGKAKQADDAVGARFFNLSKFKNVPPWLQHARPTNAGRTMSQGNLDNLHSAIESLQTVHGAVCDMGDDCPEITDSHASTTEAVTEPAFDIGETIREALAGFTV